MDTITITLDQLTQTATSIRSHNQKLNGSLVEIQTIMKQLSAYWQSPASQTLLARFQAMLPIFDSYKMTVESYAKFLDQTVDAYQAIENQLRVNADTFK